jgi:hypothetical protein
MSFATLLAATTTAFEDQPQEPAQTCHDGQPAIGWTWAGAWKPACGAHMSPLPNHRIFNTEYDED